MAERHTEEQIPWHQGFYGSVELELRAWQEDLIFERERELSKQPVRMDLLVVKKKKDVSIDTPFGRIFRGHNILEYKSPQDGLTIDSFFKVIGYAGLYKGTGAMVDAIPAEELTVSMFRHSHPRKLFRHLEKLGSEVSRKQAGVYSVSGFFRIPVQIVVTRELPPAGRSSLRLLSPSLELEEVRAFLEEAKHLSCPGDRENARAVLEVSSGANPALFERIRRDRDMVYTLESLLGVEERLEKKYAEGVEKATAADLRSLMQSLQIPLEKAMDLLLVPEADRETYRMEIERQ